MEQEKARAIFSRGLSDYMARKRFILNDVSKILDITPVSVCRMRGGAIMPTFDKVFTLVENGMRLDEIFGKELADRLVSEYQEERAKDSPIETAMQAKKILNLLLEQVGKI